MAYGIEKRTEDWPAFQKWHLAYIKQVAGDKTVPLYDGRSVKHYEGFNEPHVIIKIYEYVDLLEEKLTNFRIFLHNILKKLPPFQADYNFTKLGLQLTKGLPIMFSVEAILRCLCSLIS